MEYQSFGRSGLQTSRLCFGGMLLSSNGCGPWGMPAVVDEATSAAMLDRYVKAGGNLIDTSNNYGESEIIIGNWLKKQNVHTRRKLIICSKFASSITTIPAYAKINYPNSKGSSRKHIMDAIEDSLQKLQIKYLDIYTIHYWDDTAELEDVIRTLNGLIQTGLIRYYAVSNYTPVQLQKLISLCQYHRWELPICIQCQYNLLYRAADWELIRLCKSHGIGFLAWSPLAGGWLSNKYGEQSDAQLTKPLANSRVSFAESVHFSSWDFSTMGSNPKTWQLLRICADIAAELKTTISQVAIRWILSQEVTGCIVGPRTLAHLEDNLAIMKLKLTLKHLTILNEASRLPPIYPYCSISELTVKPPVTSAAVNNNTLSSVSASPCNERPGIQRLIDSSCSFQPTINRPAWMARLIDQDVYNLAASVNHHYLTISPSSKDPSTCISTSQTVKLALVFGGFLSYEESVATFRQISLQIGLNETIQSFISDALDLINELLLHVHTELNVTWMDSDLNLSEWIRLGSSNGDSNRRPSFPVCSCLILVNQFVLLLRFLEFSNMTLAQLKDRCIFLSGFSIGNITAYVVDISTNEERLRHNAFAAIRLVFWLAFRASQDFRQAQPVQQTIHPTTTETDLSSTQVNYKISSVLVSDVNYQDISDALDKFNKTNPFGCTFDICVVSQYDRVTISGFACYVPRLMEYLQSKFPTCLLVPVVLDVPIHIARYFPNTVASIIQDFSNGSLQFESNPCQNRRSRASFVLSSTGETAVGLSCIELVSSTLVEVCRWDLVSNYLAEVLKLTFSETFDSSTPIIMLDFGPSTPSKNLINNNLQMQQWLAQKQIVIYTMNNLPHSLMTATQGVYESILNEYRLSINTFNNHQDDIKRSIAIVGMACRFPDANNTDEFFYNLLHKKRSFKRVPMERWNHDKLFDLEPKNVYKTNVQQISVMEDIDLFDPQFFNLNGRDGNNMDPNHRLTLEMCYLALENAGYVMGEGARMGLDEQRVGVFVGCNGTDSYRKNMEANLDALVMQCVSRSMQSGRVSYFFKFCGPAIQIDTACSTSLVCLHLAVESILKGECDAAVVSAVLTSTDPAEFLTLAAGTIFSTSPTGGCRAFAADADGYTRADGVAAIVIKPYKAAIRDRDCIHALIDSTVINQSGQNQSFLLPSQRQIETLIHMALLKARIPPGAIQYIEAHGTGTQAGDPIEMNAIIKMLGTDMHRSKENPLYLGTHKAFIGHSEAAAGLAGLIKTVMMLQHKTITPHIQIDKINPKIDMQSQQQQQYVVIPEQACAWTVPHHNMPRRAIVNSYGMGGSNASCILREALTLPKNDNDESIEPMHLVTISGKQPDSVRAYCLRFIQYLVSFETKLTTDSTLSTTSRSFAELRFLRDLAYTTTARRNHFSHRIAVIVSSIKELIHKLAFVVKSMPGQLERLHKQLGLESVEILNPLNQDLFLSKDLQKSIDNTTNTITSIPTQIVFVFGGQGSQYFGMCRQLLTYENMWSSTFRLCSDLFAVIHPALLPCNMTLVKLLGADHKDELGQADGESQATLDEQMFFSTEVCQPLLFAIQYSLARMLISWGIRPSYIIGHSLGEIVAACISSAMSLEDALFLVGHRARLMGMTSKGAMLAINCTADDFNNVCQALHSNENRRMQLTVAAYNGARSIVVAGEISAIDMLQSHIATNKLFLSKRLQVKHAFHTNFMTSILSEFHSIASMIVYRKGEIPIFDTLRGELRTNFNADYWTQQLSQPIQLFAATTALRDLGCKDNFKPLCIELNPSAILTQYLKEPELDLETYCIMNKNRSDFKQIYSVVADVYVRRLAPVCWSELHRMNRQARVLSLPGYVFNYRSCWLKLPWVTEIAVQERTNESQTTVTSNSHVQRLTTDDSSETIHELSLIGKCHVKTHQSKGTFECSFPVFDRAWRLDIERHVIYSKKLFSIPLYTALTSQFASFIVHQNGFELGLNALAVVKDLMIKSPFIWKDTDSSSETCREMSILLVHSENHAENKASSNILKFTVSSRMRINNQIDASSKAVVHASGTICFTDSDLSDVNVNKDSFERIIEALSNDAQNKLVNTSYDGQKFYRLLTEFGVFYGSHYQSIEKLVLSNDALISWSKQTIPADQPYLDLNGLTLIHTSWLDSFMQAMVVQVATIPNLKKPLVIMFVEKLVCRTLINSINTTARTNQNGTKPEITQPSPTVFFTECRITIKSSNRATCNIRGFDANGNCVVLLTGVTLMTVNTELNDRSETESDVSQIHQIQAKVANDANLTAISRKSHDMNKITKNDHAAIQKIIVDVLSDSLEVDSTSLDLDENFANMGVDSLLSIEIHGKLQSTLNTTLTPTLLFEHPSVNALTSFILSIKPTLTENKEELEDEEDPSNHVVLSNTQVDNINDLM